MDCSDSYLKLVGVNLTRFYWKESQYLVDSFRVYITKSDDYNHTYNVYNTTVPNSNYSVDILNLDFKQAWVNVIIKKKTYKIFIKTYSQIHI